ncbi:hypothetical protein MTO96_019084 [Rhipicephalus appendiculatus]
MKEIEARMEATIEALLRRVSVSYTRRQLVGTGECFLDALFSYVLADDSGAREAHRTFMKTSAADEETRRWQQRRVASGHAADAAVPYSPPERPTSRRPMRRAKEVLSTIQSQGCRIEPIIRLKGKEKRRRRS